MATVGIVIPAYNPRGRLQRALASVVAQTYDDWECIVVDDGGEESLEWVDAFNPKVRRIRHANGGVSIARNRALLHTDAPLIAYLDQDDEWLESKLEVQVATMGDGDFSWTSFAWVFASGEEAIARSAPSGYAASLRGGNFLLSSLLVRREVLLAVGGFNPLLKVNQDWELVLRFMASGASGVAVNDLLVRYHLHDTNFSRDYVSAYREGNHVYGLHLDAAKARGDRLVSAAALDGRRRLRREHGMKAYEAFRKSRALADGVRALVWNPRYFVHCLGLSARARRSSK